MTTLTPSAPARTPGIPHHAWYAPSKLGKYAILVFCTLLTLGPVLWTISTSMRPVTESLGASPSLIPRSLDTASYKDVFDQVDMKLLILNSILVTAACALGQMLTAAMAGYVSRRWISAGRTRSSRSSWRR